MRNLFRTLPLLLLLYTSTTTAQLTLACEQSSGVVERRTYYSAVVDGDMNYSVYLPPCYNQANSDYPVVYLMHGSASTDTHWLELGLEEVLNERIASGALPPMIAVLPFGSWIANENQFGDVSWANVFLQDLMPHAESEYRIDERREARAIGGISRGGFWAFNIAFRQPELFSALGGHSAFFDEFHAPPEHNPLDLANNAPDIGSLRIWLDRGRDDYAQQNIDLIDSRLSVRDLPDYTYTIYPEGQHANPYWRQHVPDYLDFYAATWERAEVEYNTVISDSQSPLFLMLPAVVFPSIQYTIAADTVSAVANGESVENLIIDETTARQLAEHGIILSSDVRVVTDGDLFNTMWRNRQLFTLLGFDRLTPRYRVLHLAHRDGSESHPIDSDRASYPFAWESDTPNFDPSHLTRTVISGVTAITRNTIPPIDQNGIMWAGDGIRPYVNRADFFHTSNEVSFSPRCPASDIEPLGAFCSKDAHFELLRYIGLDIVELSGNHNADYGYDAYLRTLDMYAEAGMMTIGGGATLDAARRPLTLEHNGSRIAMLACNWVGPFYALANDGADGGTVRPGAAFCDVEWLREILPELDASHDLVIVTVQWNEYEVYQPTDDQRSDFQFLADLGADVVIGTHAHKPQTYEFYGDAFIHYGLGNLFFDQPFWGNRRFFMDQLFIYEGHLLTVDIFPGIIDDLARPRMMTPEERENFLFFMMVEQGGM